MPRPKSKPHEVRSRVAFVRLREEEWGGLAQLAATLGETPSRIMRRLIREAINGGPDYFEDGEGEIRKMRYELTTDRAQSESVRPRCKPRRAGHVSGPSAGV